MKIYKVIGFFLIVCAGCNSNESDQNSDEVKDTISTMEISEPVIDKTKPGDSIASLFSGTWISSYYLRKIKDSASVYENREYESSLLGFRLKKEDIQSGDAWLIPFSTGTMTTDRPVRWHFDDSSFISIDSPVVKLYLNNPYSLIYEYSNGNKAYFRKTTDRESAVRGTLFEGEYVSQGGEKYSFSADGTVSGFGNKTHFSILDNFSEELDFDAIFISDNIQRDNELIYHYEISGDTIRLFDLAGEYPEMGIGAIAHELIKVNK